MNALADLFREAPRPQPGTSQPIQNPDGSVTTERSITVTDERLNGGRPTNIPTVWGGQIVPDDEAVDHAARSGIAWPSYESIPAAVRAAEQRSQDLGAGRTTSVGGAGVPPEVQNALPYRNRAVRGEPIYEQGGKGPVSALEDLFPRGSSASKMHGMTIIVVPGQGQSTDDGDHVEMGAPFNFRDGIAPDGRGSDDIPLDHPSDCSSFIANLIAHLTGNKVRLPDLTDSQVAETEPVEHGDEQPGDLLFSQYPGQGKPIDWGHVAMLLKKHGDTPDQWSSLEQSDAPGPHIGGRPGVDIRQADHAIDQGGSMIVRRVPGLR